MLDADPAHDPAPPLAAAAIALAPLALAAQVAMQLAAARPVRVHEPVDPFRRDRQRALVPGPRGDLFRAPVLFDQGADPAPLPRRDPRPTAARARPLAGPPVGLAGAVGPCALIAPQLARDRRHVTLQDLRDPLPGLPHAPQGPNLIPFLSGEVRIAHRATPTCRLEPRC